MDKDISDILFSIPHNVEYTDVSVDLDLEDIPDSRINEVIKLLQNSDKYISFQAARVLTSWGIDQGFNFLVDLFQNNQLDGMVCNRLHGYDETYLHVLHALISFWANKADRGEEDYARTLIFPIISKIIDYSNVQLFPIDSLFSIVDKYNYKEYLPLLKNHLRKILLNQPEQYWKIHDLIGFVLKYDSKFVEIVLSENKLSLNDYGW